MIFFYTNPILIAAAVIPAVFLLVHVYRADKLEKEPAPLLISLVLYGIAATFIALLLERFGGWLLGRYFPENSTPYNVLMYFGVVAFSEEGAKYFLLKRRTWNSAAFNCQFDGVVYAVFVSLGFALWENISYVLMYGLSTALVRAVTAVPGHACFGVFMGVWYGLAKRRVRGRSVHGRVHPRQAPVPPRPVSQQLRRGISVNASRRLLSCCDKRRRWFSVRGRMGAVQELFHQPRAPEKQQQRHAEQV